MIQKKAGLVATAFLLAAAVGCGRPAGEPSSARDESEATSRSDSPRSTASDAKIAALRASHQEMVRRLANAAAEADVSNPYYGSNEVALPEAKLAALAKNVAPYERLKCLVQLGDKLLRAGREEEAIARHDEAWALATSMGADLPNEARAEVAFLLALAHFRFGETQNCCLRFTEDSCLLPIRGGGIHSDPRGSREAIRYLLEAISATREYSTLYFESVWLLNLAHMTLGEHPGGVPSEYLIPSEAFDRGGELPRFRNVAPLLGLDTMSMAGAAVADDFDGDGLVDLMTSSQDVRVPLRVFRNLGAAGFKDVTKESGLEGYPGGLNMVQADYDNDGDVDVYILRGAWCGDDGMHVNSLLCNQGDGTFLDATIAAGLGERAIPTQSAAWGDYDLDGNLDLYVGAERSSTGAAAQLFHNNGDGTFTETTASAGVENDRFVKGVLWGDFDGDRRPDLFVSNYFEENRLYHNRGDGTFEDVAPRLGLSDFLDSFPAFACDVNNDGSLDLFVGGYGGRIEQLAKYYLGVANPGGRSRLYLNEGAGGLVDVAEQFGLGEPTLAMGINFGDLDNDGWLDFYLGTGNPDYRQLLPNKMYRNLGGAGFEDVSTAGGFSHLQKGHAIAFADFDQDGDADVFEQMGGAYPGDKFKDALYQNPGFGAHWLGVQLVGVRSNRSAIGSRIRVVVRDGASDRQIVRWVGSGGSFGCNPLEQLIGLGAAERVVRLEIYWPATDETQTFTDLAADQTIRIVEGEDDFTRLDRAPFAWTVALP